MKFNKKLTNRSEAKQFIKDLVSNDLDFHFDEDVKDIFGRQFSELQISQLETRRDELFELLGDPFEYSIKYLRQMNK